MTRTIEIKGLPGMILGALLIAVGVTIMATVIGLVLLLAVLGAAGYAIDAVGRAMRDPSRKGKLVRKLKLLRNGWGPIFGWTHPIDRPSPGAPPVYHTGGYVAGPAPNILGALPRGGSVVRKPPPRLLEHRIKPA